MDRRSFVLGSAAAIAGAAAAHAQHAGHPPVLPAAPSSTEPYAKLQGGVPHHMTPEQEKIYRAALERHKTLVRRHALVAADALPEIVVNSSEFDDYQPSRSRGSPVYRR